jgi:type I restriction enzyme S subunit
VDGPGIIVGRKGNVGSVFWVDTYFYPIDTVFYVVTDIHLHYIYYNLLHQKFLNSDAAVPGLSRNQAYLNPFILPLSEIRDHFEQIVTPIFQILRTLRLKTRNLRTTRDLLLPKLISGQIDVENLDITVDESPAEEAA